MATALAKERTRIVCEVMADLATVPSEIIIVPWGRVRSVNLAGGFVMDEAAARMVIAEFSAHGADLPIDYEHSTVEAPPRFKAPAAGWITRLVARPGVGLVASVRWTRGGAADLAERKYRYISPVVWVNPKTNRVEELSSAGLTNKPAIVRMPALVNRRATKMDQAMFLEKLRMLADVGEDADEAAILAALGAKIEAATANSARHGDGDGDGAGGPAINKRLDAVESELRAMKRDEFIDKGLRTGKITMHSRPRWEKLFNADPAEAEEFLTASPVVAPADGVLTRSVSSRSHAGGGRTSVINAARSEYENEATLRRLCNRVDHVNGELRSAGLAPLTKEEAAGVA